MKIMNIWQKLSLLALFVTVLTATTGRSALAFPCIIPTPDCPPADCDF